MPLAPAVGTSISADRVRGVEEAHDAAAQRVGEVGGDEVSLGLYPDGVGGDVPLLLARPATIEKITSSAADSRTARGRGRPSRGPRRGGSFGGKRPYRSKMKMVLATCDKL